MVALVIMDPRSGIGLSELPDEWWAETAKMDRDEREAKLVPKLKNRALAVSQGLFWRKKRPAKFRGGVGFRHIKNKKNKGKRNAQMARARNELKESEKPKKVDRKVKEGNLAELYPELVNEWDYEKNGAHGMRPEYYTPGSSQMVYWSKHYHDDALDKDFEFKWVARIQDRAQKGHGCPYLSERPTAWPGFNDVKTRCPDLIRNEWDYERNIGLDPCDFTPSSMQKAWWHLEYLDPVTGKQHLFVWEATIRDRAVKNCGCPYLLNKKVWPGYNDLGSLYPETAAQLDPEKNNGIKASEVLPGSREILWWRKECPDPDTGEMRVFRWEAKVNSMVRLEAQKDGKAHVLTPYTSLSYTHPEVAAMWHPVKNGDITPAQILPGSRMQAWWKMEIVDEKTGERHFLEWQEKVYNQVEMGDMCPYTMPKTRRASESFNSLAATHPQLVPEWDFAKNGALTPAQVTEHDGREVWWIFKDIDPMTGKERTRSWQDSISHRAKCDYTGGGDAHKFLSGYNSLDAVAKPVADEWDLELNGSLLPCDVHPCSQQAAYWKCKEGHRWATIIANRTRKGRGGGGCPYCNETKGEQEVAKALDCLGIAYKAQNVIPGRIYKGALRDDFAIIGDDGEMIAAIEYNGEQHYRPVDFAGNGDEWAKKQFEGTHLRDKVKSEYLEAHGIPQLIIPYLEVENIGKLVRDFVNALAGKSVECPAA